MIRPAKQEEHKELVRLASSHKATSGFSHHMFSGEHAYEKGWIRVLEFAGEVLGLTCVRHKVRAPETMLYYLVVREDFRGQGLGRQLIEDLQEQSPHRRIALKCMVDNEPALKFYERLGFKRKYLIESQNMYLMALEW